MGLLGGGGVLNSSVIFGQVLLSVIENMILIHGCTFSYELNQPVFRVLCREMLLKILHVKKKS